MADKPIASLTPAIYSWNLANAQVCANLAGYALSVHGSMNRDFDLVAVPWVESADTPAELIEIMCKGLDVRMQAGDPIEKPHGRLAYTLLMDGDRFIDISVMTPVARQQEQL